MTNIEHEMAILQNERDEARAGVAALRKWDDKIHQALRDAGRDCGESHIDTINRIAAENRRLMGSRDEWKESYKTRTQSHVEQAKELFAEIKELRTERNEARALSHARSLDASELEAENRRLRDRSFMVAALDTASAQRDDAQTGFRGAINDLGKCRAQNRRLQDELEKAKADLGARNRILTEEP